MKSLSRTLFVALGSVAILAATGLPAVAADGFSTDPVSVPDTNVAPDRLVVDVRAPTIPATGSGSRGVANLAAVLLLIGGAAMYVARISPRRHVTKYPAGADIS